MAKLTLEQRITKVHEAIAKEEKIIECSKEKIKSLNSELKSLKAEKEKIFANEVLKLLKEKGINQEEFLSDLKSSSDRRENNSFSPNEEKKVEEGSADISTVNRF